MFFFFAQTYTNTAGTINIIVLIGAKEQPDLYPSMHALLTHGNGMIVFIAERRGQEIMVRKMSALLSTIDPYEPRRELLSTQWIGDWEASKKAFGG